MKYLAEQSEDGIWFAAIWNTENPSRLLDKKLCGSSEEAEALRQSAMDASAAVFTKEMLATVSPPPVLPSSGDDEPAKEAREATEAQSTAVPVRLGPDGEAESGRGRTTRSDPFDHDGNGKPGGSKPKAKRK